jgi:hypothetical protein
MGLRDASVSVAKASNIVQFAPWTRWRCAAKGTDMELDFETFQRLRRLAPVLDDILNAKEVEHPDQAINLANLARLCSQLFDQYHCKHPGETERARHDALASQ